MQIPLLHTQECLYYTWPRQSNVTAHVAASGTAGVSGIMPPAPEARFWAQLDSAPLFPECGGQPCDAGTIDGEEIIAVTEQDGRIFVWTGDVLTPGAEVQVQVDTARANEYAIHHTAQHLLSGAILDLFGFPTASMHLGETDRTIDIESPVFSQKQAQEAEALCMKIIGENRPVTVHWCPPENTADFPLRKTPPPADRIRIVEIGGFDYSPCCAPHVPSTGLLGSVIITAIEKYKGMTRISFAAGRRAFEICAAARTAANQAAQLLKTNTAEVPAAITALVSKSQQTERALAAAKDRLATFESRQLLADQPGSGIIALVSRDKTFDDILYLGRTLQKMTGRIIALASSSALRAVVMTSAQNTDIKTPVLPILDRYSGKGGGSSSLIQASFCCRDDLEHFMSAIQNIRTESL